MSNNDSLASQIDQLINALRGQINTLKAHEMVNELLIRSILTALPDNVSQSIHDVVLGAISTGDDPISERNKLYLQTYFKSDV